MTDPTEGAGNAVSSAGALDLQTFERLFHQHLNPLTRFVFSYVKSWDVAEDIVHDVFLQFWLRHHKLEPVRDLAAYLYTIARYDALDYLRHHRIEERHRQTSLDTVDTAVPAAADHELLASEAAAALHRAIDSLPPRQREIVLLRLQHQATYEDIAAKLRISYKTVDTHLQRAFERLRQVLPRLLG